MASKKTSFSVYLVQATRLAQVLLRVFEKKDHVFGSWMGTSLLLPSAEWTPSSLPSVSLDIMVLCQIKPSGCGTLQGQSADGPDPKSRLSESASLKVIPRIRAR